jgi:hypothetical protein
VNHRYGSQVPERVDLPILVPGSNTKADLDHEETQEERGRREHNPEYPFESGAEATALSGGARHVGGRQSSRTKDVVAGRGTA